MSSSTQNSPAKSTTNATDVGTRPATFEEVVSRIEAQQLALKSKVEAAAGPHKEALATFTRLSNEVTETQKKADAANKALLAYQSSDTFVACHAATGAARAELDSFTRTVRFIPLAVQIAKMQDINLIPKNAKGDTLKAAIVQYRPAFEAILLPVSDGQKKLTNALWEKIETGLNRVAVLISEMSVNNQEPEVSK